METTEHFRPSVGKADQTVSFRMIDVGEKIATRRHAVARGTICLSPDAYTALREKKNPKGDVLAQAEIAGIFAVKRVPEFIPLCHTLPIEYARLRFEFSDLRCEVTVFCEVGATAKTGVEMEALAGVNGALLAIYDLSKAVNPVLSISGIRLDVKEGGKSGRWTHPGFDEKSSQKLTGDSRRDTYQHTQVTENIAGAEKNASADSGASANAVQVAPEYKSDLENIRSAVLVVSDRCAKGEAEDRSGLLLQNYLSAQGSRFLKKSIVHDDVELIRREALKICGESESQILFVTGGTGVGPRDVTPEAFETLWTKKVPGIGELLRASGAKYTPMSYLSRGEGGFIGTTLVVLLPGSEKAVVQGLSVLDPLISHILHVSRGGDHERR